MKDNGFITYQDIFYKVKTGRYAFTYADLREAEKCALRLATNEGASVDVIEVTETLVASY